MDLDFSAATGVLIFYVGYSQFKWSAAVLNLTVYLGEQMTLSLSAVISE